jgi:protein-disulfide isomerase
LKIANGILIATATVILGAAAMAQTAPRQTQGGTAGKAQAAQQQDKPAPMVLNSIDSNSKADPFPQPNPKYFTATSPTAATVDSFLKQLWGYDPNRIWRVEAIQKTDAPGVSKVVVFVTDRSPNAKVQTTAFFVTPDGLHALAGESVIPFGAKPFEPARQQLQARADGAARGSSSKDLLIVEFADLQCPHCKEAQNTMDQIVKDFPNGRVVFQPFPLIEIHPFAFKAAAYGYCVQKQSNDAFFKYAAAVFETQEALTPDNGDETLKNAVTKAGLDPAAVDTCANAEGTKLTVNNSIKLGEDIGVDQTPMLAVNGHLLPLAGIPYETLKQIISYQAVSDGAVPPISAAATSSTRTVPSLTK